MSSEPAPNDAPLAPDRLTQLFERACKPREQWRIGIEHEKHGIYADTLAPVPYHGPRGILELLQSLRARGGYTPLLDDDGLTLIGLRDARASLTLEPGGQFELSGAPVTGLDGICREEQEHLELARALGGPAGIAWLGIGEQPLTPRDEMPWVPKRRYEIMRRYLPTRGAMALDMMLMTGTVQANFDFSDEQDACRKIRMAAGVSPLVTALYANSPFSAGHPNGFESRRYHIWTAVDPDRCGLPEFMFRPDFRWQHYADWALDAGMFFLVRDGEKLETHVPFREFLAHGFEGHRATESDWELHLSTLFPEIRLKTTIEVRGADSVSRELVCALPALWKGLLYDDGALDAAWALASRWSYAERLQLHADVARHGLDARVRGTPVVELCRDLLGIARHGLDAQGSRFEASYLDALDAVARRGKSPARELLELWDGPWQHDLRKLVEHVRY